MRVGPGLLWGWGLGSDPDLFWGTNSEMSAGTAGAEDLDSGMGKG